VVLASKIGDKDLVKPREIARGGSVQMIDRRRAKYQFQTNEGKLSVQI
jgi:hypothetical protein